MTRRLNQLIVALLVLFCAATVYALSSGGASTFTGAKFADPMTVAWLHANCGGL